MSSTHLDKLQVVQSINHRIVTGCHQKIELCSQQNYDSALQPMHPSHLIVTPRPLRATLQVPYHRILRGLRTRGDDPNAPPLIFVGVLEERAYHLVRRLLRGLMIEDIIRSQAPNKVLMATPSNRPSRKIAAPVLPKRPFLAPIRLLLKAKPYRHSVG